MGLLERVGRAVEVGLLKRDVEPLEGTNISLWNSIIPEWWAAEGLSLSQQWVPGDGRLSERVWVCNRCMQLNAQQIAGMPLKFEAPNVQQDVTPEWCSSPDDVWYPNGISDVIFSVIWHMYAWGFALLYVTSYYADGYPRNFTVLPSGRVFITLDRTTGLRTYKLDQTTLDPSRVIQIDRDPRGQAKGCSALASYSQQAWGLLAAGNTSMSVSEGGFPKVYLAAQRKLTEPQATALQTEWMMKSQQRNGAPPVLPPDVVPTELNFNPSDLALLDTQKWNAEVLCTAYGVPSVLLNMALQGGLTYQNPAALGEMWWRFELRPTAKRVADALSAQLLPKGQYVWFDASDTFLPLSDKTGPLASDTDDPQAASETTPTATATAEASPGPATLTAVGGSNQ